MIYALVDEVEDGPNTRRRLLAKVWETWRGRKHVSELVYRAECELCPFQTRDWEKLHHHLKLWHGVKKVGRITLADR